MVLIKASRTAIINPPGVTPVLTIDQLWEAMKIKARKPQDFIKLMAGCEVLHEDEQGLSRIVTFQNGWGPPGGKAEEDVKYCSPIRVDFAMRETGERISNIISTDCDDESILYMTFTIEWPHPKLEEGSEEAKQMYNQVYGMLSDIIKSSNETVRQMVRDGTIQ